MSVFLGKRQVIQKVGPIGQPQWELDSMFFLYLECRALTALQKMTYLTAPTAAGGRGVAHILELGATLLRLFYDNIMITLATDLVQKFYTYW